MGDGMMNYDVLGRPQISNDGTALHSGFIVRTQAQIDTTGMSLITKGFEERCKMPLPPRGGTMSMAMQTLETNSIAVVIGDELRRRFGLETIDNLNNGFVPIISNALGIPIGDDSMASIYPNDPESQNRAMAEQLCDEVQYAGIVNDRVPVAGDGSEPRITETQLDIVKTGTFLLPVDDLKETLPIFYPLGKHLVTNNNMADGRFSVKKISVDSFGRKMMNDFLNYERTAAKAKKAGTTVGILDKSQMNSESTVIMTRSDKIGHYLTAGFAGVLLRFLSQYDSTATASTIISDLKDFIKTGQFNNTKTKGRAFSNLLRPNATDYYDISTAESYCMHTGMNMIFEACAMRANADRPVMTAISVKDGNLNSGMCKKVDAIFCPF